MNKCPMNMRKITAIFQESMLEAVESVLSEHGVTGFTVTSVQGCGEYKNYYKSDQTSRHSRIEIYMAEAQAETVAKAIMNAAHIGVEGDGIVAISPVQSVFRIRTASKLTPSK